MTRIGSILKTQARCTSSPIHDLDRFSLTPAGEAVLQERDTASAAVEAAPVEAALSVRQAYDGPASGQPKPEWVRGICPKCSGPVVANSYYVGGKGYMIIAECWAGLQTAPTCDYRKVL